MYIPCMWDMLINIMTRTIIINAISVTCCVQVILMIVLSWAHAQYNNDNTHNIIALCHISLSCKGRAPLY